MKESIKKWFLGLYVVVLILILVVAPAIYLTGIWRIKIGSVTLNFTAATHIGLLIGLVSSGLKDHLDNLLAPREANLPLSQRKLRRWRLRAVVIAVLLFVSGVAYAIGQSYQLHAPFEYLGGLDFGKLLFFWILYIIASFFSIGMPKEKVQAEA